MGCTGRAFWDSTGFFMRYLEEKSKVGNGKGFFDLGVGRNMSIRRIRE